MKRRFAGLFVVFCIGAAQSAGQAAEPANDYRLKPEKVADGIFIFEGRTENFSRENGGNIVNTVFIVGSDGVVVIDSGPSRAYGLQQRAAISRTTPLPVTRVYNTHAHPDHIFGNQAYPGGIVAALPSTTAAITRNGEALSDNMFRLVGGWMVGTLVAVPTVEAKSGEVTVAGRKLRLIAARGHTDGDLMIFDEATKTLFTGDLVFYRRAPTTPDANLTNWLAELDEIDKIDFTTLVPGHGPVMHDHAGIAQTRDYLRWLGQTLHDAANCGLDIPEVMQLPIPERFRGLAVVDGEYTRSITHLYPAIELESLPLAAPEKR